jgi:hypothetical protein
MASIDLMSDKQDDALAAAAQLPLLDEEGLEVVGAEGFAADAVALGHGRGTRHELGILDLLDRMVVVVIVMFSRRRRRRHRLHEPSDGTRGRAVVVVKAAGPQHPKVVRIDVGIVVGGHVKLPVPVRRRGA